MVVIVGAGIVGAATAYYLSTHPCGAGTSITILDAVGPASGSSGKAGAFVTNRPPLRRGNKTDKRQALFEASFELHEQLAKDLNLESFCRVQNYQAIERTNEDDDVVTNSARPQEEESSDVRQIPSWLTELEENCYCQSLPGDAALVDPAELTSCMLNKALSGGNCSFRQASVFGVELDSSGRSVVGIHFEDDHEENRRQRFVVEKDEPVVIALGAWSCRIEDWLGIPMPMEGIVSTSLVYQDGIPASDIGTAFFFDDDSNGCHLEVSPA
jgi:glycine/D-amino acid oxidase-like deaminating enzyme